MKRILCWLSATATIALGSATAYAADLGAPPPPPLPPPPPVFTWTGLYFGINGGFGGDRFEYPFTIGGAIPALGITGPITGTSRLNSSGFFGGSQLGFNWQIAPAWVVGVEADFDAADIEGMATTFSSVFSGNVGAGGGLEYALNPWLSFKTEYLFVDLGTDTIAAGTAAGLPFSLGEKMTVHTIKVGLNMNLGG